MSRPEAVKGVFGHDDWAVARPRSPARAVRDFMMAATRALVRRCSGLEASKPFKVGGARARELVVPCRRMRCWRQGDGLEIACLL